MKSTGAVGTRPCCRGRESSLRSSRGHIVMKSTGAVGTRPCRRGRECSLRSNLAQARATGSRGHIVIKSTGAVQLERVHVVEEERAAFEAVEAT